jgi:DNA polymerase I-like protein with 3'-5' exonuclease and polymerase domains
VTRTIVTSLQQLNLLIPSWEGKRFAFDVETSGLDPKRDRLLGLALYFEDGQAFYIVMEHTILDETGVRLQQFIERKMVAYLCGSIFSQDVLMVAHNSKFDMHFLANNKLHVMGRLFDTLLAAQLLDENRKNGLKDLSESLLGFAYDKYQTMSSYEGYTKQEILGVPLENVAEYAMNDVEATWKLYEIFSKELANHAMEKVFLEVWLPLLPVLQAMESRGIALNMDLVKEIHAEQTIVRDELERKVRLAGMGYLLRQYELKDIPEIFRKDAATEAELLDSYENKDGVRVILRDGIEHPIITHDMIGKTRTFKPRVVDFKTSSSLQMQMLVFEWSGVNIPDKIPLTTNTRGYKADKDNIETLLFYVDSETPPFLQDVLDWRKAEKFIGTYLDRFIADADPNDEWSIRTNFNQAVGERGKGGTATGRLSSDNPNLQNIPSRGPIGKKARNMFVARKGYKLIVADYSQMELRLLAHYSEDPVLLQAFAEGKDLHILTATAPARARYEEILDALNGADEERAAWAKEMRSIGKTMNFALNYGMGPKKFQRFLLVMNKYEITIEEADEWIQRYNATYQVTTDWKKSVADEVGRNGYIKTIYGRRRRLPDYNNPTRWIRERAKRQGVNAKIQGGCGDIIERAMLAVQPMLVSLGGSLLLQVHDELVGEVPEKWAEIGARHMEQLMVDFINPYLNVPMEASAHIGNSWGEAKAA